MLRAITLLSGGLDSFISTAIARKKHKVVLALTFDYGQRAARRELLATRKMCRMWHIPHKVIKLPWLARITSTSLVNRQRNVPKFSTYALTHLRTQALTAQAVWVPNRNALFINIGAAFAETLHAQGIVTGFNKEEGVTFPDNSAMFVASINKTLTLGTLEHWNTGAPVVSFVQQMTKKDMVRYALRHKLPLDICWPCYEGGRRLCGRCESCVRFFRALKCNHPSRSKG